MPPALPTGEGYVAAEFVHFMFVPLLPVGSAVIRDRSTSNGWVYCVHWIPFSWKSIVFAWTRALLLFAGIAFAAWPFLTSVADQEWPNLTETLPSMAYAGILWCLLYISFQIDEPGEERKQWLRQILQKGVFSEHEAK